MTFPVGYAGIIINTSNLQWVVMLVDGYHTFVTYKTKALKKKKHTSYSSNKFLHSLQKICISFKVIEVVLYPVPAYI